MHLPDNYALPDDLNLTILTFAADCQDMVISNFVAFQGGRHLCALQNRCQYPLASPFDFGDLDWSVISFAVKTKAQLAVSNRTFSPSACQAAVVPQTFQ